MSVKEVLEMVAQWQIDPAEPAEPSPRERSLYAALACTSPHENRHVTGMAAYARIVGGWGVAFPGAPTTHTLAALLAAAEPVVWPSPAQPAYGTPTEAAPSRRPDAARAPSPALRPDPFGRAAAA